MNFSFPPASLLRLLPPSVHCGSILFQDTIKKAIENSSPRFFFLLLLLLELRDLELHCQIYVKGYKRLILSFCLSLVLD